MLDHLRKEFGSIWLVLLEGLKIFVYHIAPIGSTTVILVLATMGGLNWPIILWYLSIVFLCCLLLAISTVSGK